MADAAKSSTPPRGLTDSYLEKLARAKRTERLELGDAQCPGLRARVAPTGLVSFVWYYRQGDGRTRVETLGRWPGLSLKNARAKMQQLKAAKDSGALGEQLVGEHTKIRDLVELFVKHLAVTRKGGDGVRSSTRRARSYLERLVVPGLGDVRVDRVSSVAIGNLIQKIVAAGTPSAAASTFGLLKQAFRFARGMGLSHSNPCDGLDPRSLGAVDGAARQRVLTTNELALLWRSLDDKTMPAEEVTRLALRIVLLTGVRQGELVQAQWPHLDLANAVWNIPPETRKLTVRLAAQAQDFKVPLSPPAVAAFERLKARAKDSPWVFASPRPPSPHLGYTTLPLAARNLCERLGMQAWHPHDLRRTARTYWTAKLAADPLIAERSLGHAVGGKVFRTYDVDDYLPQRRALLDKWAAYVEHLAQPEAPPVAFLPARPA